MLLTMKLFLSHLVFFQIFKLKSFIHKLTFFLLQSQGLSESFSAYTKVTQKVQYS